MHIREFLKAPDLERRYPLNHALFGLLVLRPVCPCPIGPGLLFTISHGRDQLEVLKNKTIRMQIRSLTVDCFQVQSLQIIYDLANEPVSSGLSKSF